MLMAMRDTVVGRLSVSRRATTVVNYLVVVAVDAFSFIAGAGDQQPLRFLFRGSP